MILIFKGKGADIALALLTFLAIHCIISFYQSKKMMGTFLHTKCAICCLTWNKFYGTNWMVINKFTVSVNQAYNGNACDCLFGFMVYV